MYYGICGWQSSEIKTGETMDKNENSGSNADFDVSVVLRVSRVLHKQIRFAVMVRVLGASIQLHLFRYVRVSNVRREKN